MPVPLSALEQQRSSLLQQISELGDFRPGSITGTRRRWGTPSCHCHRANDPGHLPHLRFTYKVDGKSMTERLRQPCRTKEGRSRSRRLPPLSAVEPILCGVNEKICRARRVEETLSPQGKKRSKPSSKKLPRK
jgi:uncharacterized protein DUF6788